MADTPEKKVKSKVVKILKEYQEYYFYPVTGGYGASGVPDIIVCFQGQFIGIEVKADMKKNPPTMLQRKNLSEISACGGIAVVIDNENVGEVRNLLQFIERGIE